MRCSVKSFKIGGLMIYEYTTAYATFLLKKLSKQLYTNFTAFVEHNPVEYVRIIETGSEKYSVKNGTWLGSIKDKNYYLEV